MDNENIIKFIETVNKLKEVRRAGWVERGVKNPESVADHNFLAALLCMVIPAKGVDKESAIKMAMVHDLAESVIGDIITTDKWKAGGKMSRPERVKMEAKAFEGILANLDKETADEILGLWNEFEQRKTKEAKFVHDVENAETLIQANIYHRKGNYKKPLVRFWDENGLSQVQSDDIKRLVKDILGST